VASSQLNRLHRSAKVNLKNYSTQGGQKTDGSKSIFSLKWPWPLTPWLPKLICSCSCPVDRLCLFASQGVVFSTLIFHYFSIIKKYAIIIIIISGFGIYGAAVVPDSGVGNTWQRLTLVLHEFLSCPVRGSSSCKSITNQHWIGDSSGQSSPQLSVSENQLLAERRCQSPAAVSDSTHSKSLVLYYSQ